MNPSKPAYLLGFTAFTASLPGVRDLEPTLIGQLTGVEPLSQLGLKARVAARQYPHQLAKAVSHGATPGQ